MEIAIDSTGTLAFKEWYAIVQAIGAGRQRLILRKGGIHEGKKGFQAGSDSFWLFPTYFHQQWSQLKPEIGVSAIPEASDGVPIQFFCQRTGGGLIGSAEALTVMADQHFWTEDCVRDKFVRGGEAGIYCLELAVYALSEPVWLPMRKSYGGCRSWIELEGLHQQLGNCVLKQVVSRE